MITFLFPLLALAAICPEWLAPRKVGALETKFVNEASGLAVSRLVPGRFYHHNDSGDGPYFYVTDATGRGTRRIAVPGMVPQDIEDMSLGPCPAGTCLFLGDIGDNDQKRGSIDIWLVPEVAEFPANAQGARKVTLRYPDRAHDAESLAVHPTTGDLYLLTKEADYDSGRASAGILFRVPATALRSSSALLERVGEVDLPFLNSGLDVFGQIATAMDISPEGDRLLVLTYLNAVEISLGSLGRNVREWRAGRDYSVANWPRLVSQQEAIAYRADGRAFFFDTEFNSNRGDKDAGIYRVDCK